MANTIVINGKTYVCTKDDFGCTFVNGMPVDKFLDTMSEEDKLAVAVVGIKKAHDDPAWFDDAAERLELPDDVVKMVKDIVADVDT
jgi:hypothetical protein